jgi:Bacterial dnaA protein helix-turn-helix
MSSMSSSAERADVYTRITAEIGALPPAQHHHADCHTAADVQACAARARAARERLWPAQHPSAPAAPTTSGERSATALSLNPIATLPAGRISVRRVLEVTARHFDMTVEDLVAHRRFRCLVHRRWVAMYVAHKLTNRGMPFIARYMGDRDHTTVLYGIRAATALIDAGDADIIGAVNAIVEQIQGGAYG